MAIIDRDLVRAINSGRCFAVVGAGPSCELGAPSWKRLTEIAIAKLDPVQHGPVIEQCKLCLTQNNYPRVFSLIEKTIGRSRMYAALAIAVSNRTQEGHIYKYLAAWPFACYLTTNFDDYLLSYLTGIRCSFIARRNSLQDMRTLHSESTGIIVKIHGDFSVPNDIVLTEEQYLDFKEGKDRGYWRDKILSLNMVNVVIVGYSASDPDFREQLERAKNIAAPDHPVFMFAADLTDGEITEYYQKYNIRIIGYSNEDGTHRDLHRLLRRYDPFIAKRGSSTVGLPPADESVAALASSMYLFTKLRLADTADACIQKTYASSILHILGDLPDSQDIKIDTLRDTLAKKTFAASNVDVTAMQKALESLYSGGIISWCSDRRAVNLELKGQEALAEIKAQKDAIKEKFDTACYLFLKREYPAVSSESYRRVIDSLRIGIVKAFEKRGMEIARSVFGDDMVDISDATDVLEIINRAGSHLSGDELRQAFADLMIEVMLRPDPEIKEYLAALSQGYFAYHALGLEPRCSAERLDMTKGKKWVLDSSILLPILALDCQNFPYAKDLSDKMQNLGLDRYTTSSLFGEVLDHAWWAIRNFREVPPENVNLLQAATVGPGYKRNLFLDGFIKWAPSQGAPTLQDYMSECLGQDHQTNLPLAIKRKIQHWGIKIVDFSEWPGFSQSLWSERDEIAGEIENLRKEYGTYRGESQCDAEAEVVLLCKIDNAMFLSQSGILNKLKKTEPGMTWKPEAMYRFLSLFSSTPTGTDLLYSCMVQDFFYAGFDIIDKRTISQFVSPMVRQARMQMEKEKQHYENTLGKKRFVELKDEFEHVPDEQKPFYSMQFAFFVAAEESHKREVAETRARRAEESERLSERERKEFSLLKAERKSRQEREKKRKRKFESVRKHKKKKKKKKH